MEDQGNSGTKKVQRDLTDNPQGDGPLFSGPHLSNDNESDKYFSSSLNNNLVHLSLLRNRSNLRSIHRLGQISKTPSIGQDIVRKNQKSNQLFWKAFNKGNENFLNHNQDLSPLVLRKKTVDLLHSELYSWNTVLRHLVSMPSLSIFNICQILCHEKGTTNVYSYSHGSDNQLKETKTSIESFNKVFNQIKKSKGNQFSQTQLTIPEFNFTGSFLASVFQLRTHNVLFLLSDNSFFPISDEAIEELSLLNRQIESVLTKVIDKDLSDSKISNLYRVFEILPIPIAISGPLGNLIFQNEEYKKTAAQENSESSSYMEAGLTGDYTLQMFLNSELSKSDIQHFQRVGLLGELLNTLQHELSNPLFGIQLATDFLSLNPNNASAKESLEEVSDYCKRCQNIIRDFKFLYQGGDKFINVSLTKIIKETLTLTKSASRGIKKILNINGELENINTNPTWLSQILFNLIINSSQAIQQTSQLDGVVEINVNKNDGGIIIEVSDNGPGIDENETISVFDPFYTTKEKGTGLGLSICQSLAEKLGGEMHCKKSHLGGASFSLLLPNNEITSP